LQKKTHTRRFLNFGFSTIVIAFVMICIVTFCALALLTANSDYRLSKKVADRTTQYYQAQETAYQTLAQIDALLQETYRNSLTRDAYFSDATTALDQFAAEHSDIEFTAADTTTVSYQVAINENQMLCVSLLVCYPPDSGGGFYQLTEWKSVTELPSQEDQPMHLLGS
jgi:hypothetical protein